MKRSFLALLALGAAVACSDPSRSSPAQSVTGVHPSDIIIIGGGPIFGPQACVRSTGKPADATFTFNAADGGSAKLIVTDNGVQGLNGTITLNGVEVVSHPMLGGNGAVNDTISVTTAASNTLVCTLEGKPGSGVSLTVTQ